MLCEHHFARIRCLPSGSRGGSIRALYRYEGLSVMTTPPLPLPFAATLDGFLRSLVAKNRTPATLVGYRGDVGAFLAWLAENTDCGGPQDVSRMDITEYLAERGQAGVSGLSRARNLAAIKEYFRYLVDTSVLTDSP